MYCPVERLYLFDTAAVRVPFPPRSCQPVVPVVVRHAGELLIPRQLSATGWLRLDLEPGAHAVTLRWTFQEWISF